MVQSDIQIMLRDSFHDADVMVSSNDGTHFEAIVITDAFQNKKPVDRQRMIYAIIGAHITSGAIHALSLKTFTHQEWQQKCGS